jgi:crossover junction endodeoxyribonuclease RuvC
LKVLGIDPGSRITGYGVVLKGRGGSLTEVCHGVIRLSPGASLPNKLLEISEGLGAIIEEHRPDAVAIEDIFFAKNVRSAIMLGHARGVSMLSAASFGLDVFEYAPMKIKQAVTGYGNAPKEQVQKMVKALLKCSFTALPDAADALATAICHINHTREGVSGPARYEPRTPAPGG